MLEIFLVRESSRFGLFRKLAQLRNPIDNHGKDREMATVYIEARPKGRQEGSRITDYVVEIAGDVVLHTASTQHDAINWAKRNGQPSPCVGW